MERIEFIRLDADRATRTREGWIKDRPVLTRAGVFVYRNADGTERREFRPPEEVFRPDHLASMQGVPITTAEHHNRMLKADEDGTVIGAVCSPGQRVDAESLDCIGDIVIHHPAKLGTRRELSLGYSIGRLDETPGEWMGQRYDAIQRDLTVNHCAVVARGRAGNARLRLDGADAVSGEAEQVIIERTDTMADTPQPFGVALRLDNGLEYRASPEVAVAFNAMQSATAQLRADAAAEKAKADGLAAERDELKRRLAEADAKAPQLRADAIAEAKARLALEAIAGKHGVEVRADAADNDVKLAVLKKLRPEAEFAGKPDAYVAVAFDMAIEAAGKADDAVARSRAAIAGTPSPQARADSALPSNPPNGPPVVRSAREVREIAFRNGALY